jgi:GH25 family lysozyme M1 (1,4-beta-N-acetylmuramidase)
MSYNGIDLSDYQGIVDFNAIKADGNDIVYIKSTEGKTWKESNFRTYYNQAIPSNLKVGVYHFLRNNSPLDEVNNVLSVINGLNFQCKLAIDCETTLGQSKQQITSNIRQFYDIMKSKGIECVLYTYTSFLRDNIDYNQLIDIPVWIANYSSNNPNVPHQVGWQYTEHGRCAGILNECDKNIFENGILIGNNSNSIQNVNLYAPQSINNSGNLIIRTIQSQLNAITRANLVVDGISGSNTIAKIKEFQTIMGIQIDGIWGKQCVDCVSQIYSKPLCGLPYHQPIPTRLIQFRCGIKFDGVFGNDTANHVKSWQSSNGLQADGVFGNQSWNKLLS